MRYLHPLPFGLVFDCVQYYSPGYTVGSGIKHWATHLGPKGADTRTTGVEPCSKKQPS